MFHQSWARDNCLASKHATRRQPVRTSATHDGAIVYGPCCCNIMVRNNATSDRFLVLQNCRNVAKVVANAQLCVSSFHFRCFCLGISNSVHSSHSACCMIVCPHNPCSERIYSNSINCNLLSSHGSSS